MQGALRWPFEALNEARGTLFPWVAVFLACGVGLWFALPFEPRVQHYGLALGVLAAALAVRRWGGEVWHPLAVAVACVAVGVLACGVRAQRVAAPMLEFRYYGPIEGRIIAIDRSQSDKLRLTLDRVVLRDVAPGRVPVKVRVSVEGTEAPAEPGQVVILTGFLSAPEGPSEPGGFDFRRMAFFDQLGAVGYARSPVLLWAAPEAGAQVINRLRTRLSAAITARVPGDAGAFASGVMTGDRAGISQDTVRALRDSNLAHLLAISGMNMAFLSAFVFMLIRYGVALCPPLALRVHAKKVAAVVAFGVALFYLLLSGANVATERAFLMISVMLGAVLLDRRALTLRAVALAAVVLLLVQPESLGEPGFQLSFAATVVLIAGFAALERGVLRERVPRWMLPLFTLVLSSLLAGAATAPFAAAHFNRFTDYGLIANLLTVPVMSLLMAAGAVAALIGPLGLGAPAFWVMELSARWILFVAHWIAGLEGSVTPVVAPGPWVLPLITLGGIWAVAWRGRARMAGIAPVALAFVLWFGAERPVLLISSDGALAGLMGAEGRVLSGAKGAGFTAESWLENDGDLAGQQAAAARTGFTGPRGARAAVVAGWRLEFLSGKGAGAQLAAACARADLVVLAATVPPEPAPEGCHVIDRQVLRDTGALSVLAQADVLRVVPVRRAGRIWEGPRPLHGEIRLERAGMQLATAPDQ